MLGPSGLISWQRTSPLAADNALKESRTNQWIASGLLSIRLSKDGHREREAVTGLRSALAELSPDAREAAFWAEDAFLARLHQSKDAWHRVFDLSQQGGIQLNTEKDGVWIRKHLSDPDEAYRPSRDDVMGRDEFASPR